ncbi:hypothetical protein B0I08_101423 [Glaciihabitans tibetensis]|uniref:Uncharacterized protein n=1 Tax=Glaciihabitans tibetensis TaxID=1266600 RepID=A0A2T0VJA3_9MICO|nr:hypothetical protein [Glaciihabitans tibetensis]PRY70293.1 hypothetical protein B0I08_101423 [Glaciihabitans tibetensis]
MTSPVTRPTTIVQPQGRGLGLAALVYCVAAFGYQIACVLAAGQTSSLDTSSIDTVLPLLPFVILFGIAFCLVAGIKTPRGRKLAVAGGIVLAAGPIVALLASLIIGEVV